MGSSSKRRQTMAKLTRERALQERRALKQEKKEQRKQAAAERGEEAADPTVSPDALDDETPSG